MQNEKPVSTPLASHFKLSKEMCLETQEEIDVDVYVTSECILLCILYYCNPMFIPGCFYYVFESCGHAPMFRSGGL